MALQSYQDDVLLRVPKHLYTRTRCTELPINTALFTKVLSTQSLIFQGKTLDYIGR